MIYSNFHNTLNTWLAALNDYSFEQLLYKPATDKWSVGQVYMHLIESTEYFLQQVKIAAGCDDCMNEETTKDARRLFISNEFPDVLLEGPESNAFTPQPSSKQQITDGLLMLKSRIEDLEKNFSASSFKGKTKHIGIGYLNATEWLRFAEMHCRHHFRQKKRLDDWLMQLKPVTNTSLFNS